MKDLEWSFFKTEKQQMGTLTEKCPRQIALLAYVLELNKPRINTGMFYIGSERIYTVILKAAHHYIMLQCKISALFVSI